MIILGIYNVHDAGAALFDDYKMVASVALERMTRIKSDGDRFPSEAVDECLVIAGLKRSDVDVISLPTINYPAKYFKGADPSDAGIRDLLREMRRARTRTAEDVFDVRRFLADNGFGENTKPFFYNHHMSHALAGLFHTDWDSGVTYTFDGGGDRQYFSARTLKDGKISTLFGGEDSVYSPIRWQSSSSSVALLYAKVTEVLGFKPLRHEGKILGLAAFGKPRFTDLMGRGFKVDGKGRVYGLHSLRRLAAKIEKLAETEPREDIAASLQKVTEELMLRTVERIMRHAPSKHLALAGGLFANVRVNQRLAEELGLDELFVYPAMSDQGEAAGGVLQYLLARDGEAKWLASRYRFETMYYGRDHSAGIDAALRGAGAVKTRGRDAAGTAAAMIDKGAAVATFLERMEYGPRALGARSIMASARQRSINDSLNTRLDRTEFMPFAPFVRAERANEVFDIPASLTYAANFMTTTCNVKKEWQEKIPAVVHVDGTARPQIIHRHQNPVYYDVMKKFEELTGEPALINTSFNAHEEPIINTPEECARALVDNRVDAILTPNAVWKMPGSKQG